MTKEKNDKNSGEKFLFSDYRSPISILGICAVVAAIFLIFPIFWKDHKIFVSLFAAGLAMFPLFSLWKFWVGYGWQVGIAPSLTFVLMSIFIWFFGYDSGLLWVDAFHNLFWTNLLVLSIWLILVMFAFRPRSHGEVWQDYRWIIAPAVLILLFLFDISWAQSTLSMSHLERSIINSAPLDAGLQLYAEYPTQVLFDDSDDVEIHLWTIGSFGNTKEKRIVIYSDKNLVFAIKPESDAPIEWDSILPITLTEDTHAITLLVQAVNPPELNSQHAQLILRANGKALNTSAWKGLSIEGRHDSQVRSWKNNFLEISGTVVSLITAVFVGVKQLEEEKKRQKTERIKQVLSTFDIDIRNDLTKTLEEHIILVQGWNEWDKALQDQFCYKYSLFVKKDLWQAIANRTLTDIKDDIERCLQVFERIFEHERENPILTIRQLQLSLRQDDGRNILSLIRDHPQSTIIAKRIIKNYPKESKDKITKDLQKEYPREIIFLSRELGFPTEYPLLSNLFWRYSTDKKEEERLEEWLKIHSLALSPFLDFETPFTSISSEVGKFIVDQTAPGYLLDLRSKNNAYFYFKNTWDLQAAIYSFCKTLPTSVAAQAFVILFSPSLFTDYDNQSPKHLILHALGEQWLSTIADEPTLFYDLNTYQQKNLARLLCWHCGSSHTVLHRFSEELDKRYSLALGKHQLLVDSKNIRDFVKKTPDWLEGVPSTSLLSEEVNNLVDLRPSSTYRTFVLTPFIDLGIDAPTKIPRKKHELLDTVTDWLELHRYTLVHFQLSDQEWWRIKENLLIQNLTQRILFCIHQEEIALDQKIITFNDLFAPHDKNDSADEILARKADGSLGEMVRLGQKLLIQHVLKPSPSEFLDIEDLITLK